MPLDFVRQPQPRNCEDYIAVRKCGALEMKYGIWFSTDSGGQFGLVCRDLPHRARQAWEMRYRGHCGIVWMRTKRNCEKVANEIADIAERETRDSVVNRVGKIY